GWGQRCRPGPRTPCPAACPAPSRVVQGLLSPAAAAEVHHLRLLRPHQGRVPAPAGPVPQAEIVKRLNGICAQVLPYLSQEHQQQVLGAIERAKQVTAPELNSIIRDLRQLLGVETPSA
uniref:TLE family member 5, transcriptional modulator n=1 Tax=Anser cygnoides TaxID=8845 RepID=A0A8B9ECB5_ANSCY